MIDLVCEYYRIVENHMFEKAQDLLRKRAPEKRGDFSGIVRNVESPGGLWVGIVFCGYCGGCLTFNRNQKPYTPKSGEQKISYTSVYRCGKRIDDPNFCKGQSVYRTEPLDKKVDTIVREFLSNIKMLSESEMLKSSASHQNSMLRFSLEQAENALNKAQTDMASVQDEAIKALTGESTFSPEFVKGLISKQTAVLDAAKNEYERLLKEAADEEKLTAEQLTNIHLIKTWADIYDAAEIKQKRMIVAAIVEKVKVFKEDNIDISLKLTMEQFLHGA